MSVRNLKDVATGTIARTEAFPIGKGIENGYLKCVVCKLVHFESVDRGEEREVGAEVVHRVDGVATESNANITGPMFEDDFS